MFDHCELSTIGYWELRGWREACDYLTRHDYRWISLHHLDEYRHPLLSYWCRHRRQLLWDLYKIQLVKWCQNPQANYRRKPKDWSRKEWDSSGWLLLRDWEEKINYLEQVIVLERSPSSLPMPWIHSSPKPWDAVLSQPEPKPWDAVLGGDRQRL